MGLLKPNTCLLPQAHILTPQLSPPTPPPPPPPPTTSSTAARDDAPAHADPKPRARAREVEMAGRLTAAGSRVLGGHGAAARAAASALRHRAGMGLPVGRHIVPDKPLPTNDELVWDNGTPFPEPCIDRLAPHIGKYEALAWLCGGLGFFATLGLAATLNDKASKIPYTPKVYPYDNLREELALVFQNLELPVE
uniref:NADH dehydrogenase [ubiquinone] 1 beta subcomplex subunit 8, mitochondrial n=1 Tax=Oryza punctata TaxID=4537 RepID=A0A0E0MAG7_ORYPU